MDKQKSYITLLLFEDNNSYRKNISMFLETVPDFLLAGAFADANEALKRVHNGKPDVVLMDIQMPGVSGLDALKQIKAKYPNVKVLIQTVFEDEHRIFTAICSGASGYVLKNPDPDYLEQAIRDVYAGGGHMSPSIAMKAMQMFQHQFVQKQVNYVPLSDREKEILGQMVQGKSYKMIADAVCLSYHTVHWHVKNIYEKLHVNSAPEAVAMALERKMV